MFMNLRSNIVWSPLEGKVTAAEVTYGMLTIFADDVLIWGDPDFEWTWVELIEWLSYSWAIIDRERVAGRSRDEIEANLSEDEFADFLYKHNVSQAFGGVLMPELLIWRDGTTGYIETSVGLIALPVSEWKQFFLHLGYEIAQRMTDSGDERARFALHDWALHSVTI